MIAWFGASVHLANMAAGARGRTPRKGSHRNSTRRPSSVCWSAARVALARAPSADGGCLSGGEGFGPRRRLRSAGCVDGSCVVATRAACRGSLEKYFVVPAPRRSRAIGRRAKRPRSASPRSARCAMRAWSLCAQRRRAARHLGRNTEGERARVLELQRARAELRGVSGDRHRSRLRSVRLSAASGTACSGSTGAPGAGNCWISWHGCSVGHDSAMPTSAVRVA